MGKTNLETDVFIIGAGLIGSSVAAHLSDLSQKTAQSPLKIHVADVDLDGSFSSSERNAGGVRATWYQPLNAEIGRIGLRYFKEHREEIGYTPCGYTFLYDAPRWEIASEKAKALSNPEFPIETLGRDQIQKRYPFLANLEEIAGATFSPKDGLINPNSLKLHFRKIAKSHGVEFLDGTFVEKIEPHSETLISLSALKSATKSEESIKGFLTTPKTDAPLERLEIKTKILINCAGAWSGHIASLYQNSIPTKPIRRQIAVVNCRDLDLKPYGMIVDTSGLYFHPEAQNIMVGWADPKEPEGFNFEYDEAHFFMEEIWPKLWHRVPVTEHLKHLSGWAGLYAESPDHSAIVGNTPGHQNIFEAHSFSGRGAMQSPAIGMALSELIVHGEYKTLDLTPLSQSRFQEGNFIREDLII